MATAENNEQVKATVTTKSSSAVSKKSRGIDSSLITTWIDLNIEPDRHAILVKAAKQRGVKLAAMLGMLLKARLDSPDGPWKAITEEAVRYTPTSGGKKPEDMTPDELAKAISAAKAKIAIMESALKGGK